MKAGILIVCIVLVSGLIAGLIIKNNFHLHMVQPSPKRVLPASIVTYRDPIYGFSFTYPSSYSLEKDLNDIIVSDKNDTNFKLIGSVVAASSLSGVGRQPWLLLCHNTFNAVCLIDSQTIFTNGSGTTGDSYYVSTASKSAELEKAIKGPIYSFPLPLPEGTKGLLLFYIEGLNPNDKEKNILKDILLTLTLPIPRPSLIPTKTSSESSQFTSGQVASSSAK